MRKRGIVADYLRHPQQPVNQYIESVLIQADQRLRAGDYLKAEKALSAVNGLLDQMEASRLDDLMSVYDETISAP
jgi:hypothetical protein